VSLVPLTTERLRLRALTVADHPKVFDVLGDEQTTARVSWRQPDLESARAWLERRIEEQREHRVSMWAVEALTTGEMIGLCGFFSHAGANETEVGYVIKARLWGRGYATEAAQAAVASAAQAGHRLYATIRPWNIGSIRVAERAGLRLDERIEDDRGQLLVYRSP
jgi:RimJ/RimL family protein N-acetyltransferase